MIRRVLKKYDLKYIREELIIHPLNIILLFFISTSSVVLQADLAINFYETVISFLIISVSGIVVYILISLMIKNRIKSSLIISTILFITLFFRDIYELLDYKYEPKQKPKFLERLNKAIDNGWKGLVSFIIGLFYIWPIILALLLIYIGYRRILKKKKNSSK